MAATALAARTRFGVWSVWAMQGRGFGSESADNLGSSAGAVRDAGGAFGKKEQAEEERYFRITTMAPAVPERQGAALRDHLIGLLHCTVMENRGPYVAEPTFESSLLET
uniref:ATPase inhibitor, mitochondrial n=1 Tax=Balaenoptera musculus TaxID=9771 RepID=A0A8C0C4D0_BALMU